MPSPCLRANSRSHACSCCQGDELKAKNRGTEIALSHAALDNAGWNEQGLMCCLLCFPAACLITAHNIASSRIQNFLQCKTLQCFSSVVHLKVKSMTKPICQSQTRRLVLTICTPKICADRFIDGAAGGADIYTSASATNWSVQTCRICIFAGLQMAGASATKRGSRQRTSRPFHIYLCYVKEPSVADGNQLCS